MASALQHRTRVLKPAGGPSFVRRIFRWIVRLLVAVVAALVAIVLLLETQWAHDRVRRLIESRVSEMLDGELRIGAMTGSFWSHITLANVVVTQGNAPVITIGSVSARYRPWRVYTTGTIDEIVLTGLDLDLVETERGWNITGLFRQRSTGPRTGPVITIEKLAVKGGSVDLVTIAGAQRHLADLNLSASFRYDPKNIQLNVERTTVQDLDTLVAIREMSGNFSFGSEALAVENLHLVTAASRLVGRFQLTSVTKGRELASTIDATPLSPNELAHYFPQFANISVMPDVKATVRGPLDRLDVTLSARDAAGNVDAQGVAALSTDPVRFNGAVQVANFNLAPWIGERQLASRITGNAKVDLAVPTADPKKLSVGFQVRAPDVLIVGYRAQQVNASGTFRAGVLDATGTAVAFGARTRSTVNWRDGDLSAHGEVSNVDARRLVEQFPAVPALASNVAGKYDTAVGRNGSWRVDMTLDESTIEGATISTGSTVHVSGDDSELGDYAFRGAVTGLDLNRVRPFIEKTTPPEVLQYITGAVNADVDLKGRGLELSTATADLRLRLEDSAVAGVDVSVLDGTASLSTGRLIADVQTTLGGVSHQTIGVTTKFSTDGTATAHVEIADLKAADLLADLKGTVVATLTNSKVQDIAIDRIQVDAALADGLVSLATLEVESPDAKVTAAGTLAIRGEGESKLKYDATVSDLAKLPEFLTPPPKGRVHVAGTISGTWTNPTTSGEIKSSELDVKGFRALTFNGRYKGAAPDWDFANGKGEVTGEATFIEIQDTKIDKASFTVGYDAGIVDADAVLSQQKRTLRFAGSLAPHPQHQEIHIRSISAELGDMVWTMPSGQEAVVQYAADRIDVRGLDLARNGSHIRVNGTVDPSGTAVEPLTVALESVRIEDVNAIMLGTQDVGGQLDATVRLLGTLSAPRVSADGTVTAGRVGAIPFERLTAKADYEADRLSLDVHLVAGIAGDLKASGTMPVQFGAKAPASAPPFDLRLATSELQLGLLQPMTTHVLNIGGTGTAELTITGPAAKPAIAGDINITGGTFLISPTGMTYSGGKAAMSFKGDRLVIQEFRLEDVHRHPLTINGGVNVSFADVPTAFDVYAAANDFHVLDNRLGELSLNLDLHALGDLNTPLMVGTIEIERARLELDDLLDRFAGGGYRPIERERPADPAAAGDAAGKPESARSSFENSSFSITLDLPDNVVLRGRDLRVRGGGFGLGDINTTVGGALTIAKESGEPITVRGRVNFVRGNYTFQGRRFTILRDSALIFAGGDPLNPGLDVRAERQIGGVTAQVRVTGFVRTPELLLTSTPPLDQGDILSLIVFNTTMNELGTGERVSLAGRAGTLAARAFATPLADSVMRALDLDLFEIETNDDVTTGGTLTIGRQVNDRLFVGFRQNFGNDDVSQVSFELRLSQFLRLVTSFAQGADRSRSIPRAETAGLDLFFVIRK